MAWKASKKEAVNTWSGFAGSREGPTFVVNFPEAVGNQCTNLGEGFSLDGV